MIYFIAFLCVAPFIMALTTLFLVEKHIKENDL